MSRYKEKKFSLNSIFHSFQFAFDGMKYAFKERNFQIQVLIFFLVLLAGFYFKLNQIEWVLIIMVSGFVFVSEIFNTALEYLADSVSLEFHPMVKISKDVSAFAVLFSATISILIGAILFLPKVIHEFFN